MQDTSRHVLGSYPRVVPFGPAKDVRFGEPCVSVILSAYTWIAISLLILFWLPLLAIIRVFDRDPAYYRTGRWFRRLGAVMTRVNPFWNIEVSGAMPADPRRPYIVICNHQSLADIPIVSLLPWEMKWIGKESLFGLPVVGWMMQLAGDIPVERQNNRSRAIALVKAREYLHKRCSVIFFAEGTRSPDGRVHGFQDGAAGLAIREGLPMLVLALDGTRGALPKNSWRFSKSALMRVKVVGEVSTDGLRVKDAAELTERIRQMVIAQVAEWRGCDRAEVDAVRRVDSSVG